MHRLPMKLIHGFSMVELMVGLVISMIVTLAVFQTFALFESQKRTTSSGADAQTNGLVALQSLERDIKMAGDGMANDYLQGCARVFHYYNPAAVAAASPIPNFSLAAVSITDGGGGAPDTVRVRRGNSVRSNAPIKLKASMTAVDTPLQVDTPVGFSLNDQIVIADQPFGGNCTLRQVSGITNFGGGAFQINHAGGAGSPFNAPAGTPVPVGWAPHTDKSQIFHLGTLLQRAYTVNANTLQSQDFPAPAALALASDIVQLQAQYGVDQNADESIDCWTDASGGCGLPATPTPVQFKLIKAIRIAIVARSALQERGDASGTCSTTTVAPQAWVGMPQGSVTMDLSANADWRCFRYRLYETTVPLRNVIWGNVST
jgi:type IV pilus assembly protein PilW